MLPFVSCRVNGGATLGPEGIVSGADFSASSPDCQFPYSRKAPTNATISTRISDTAPIPFLDDARFLIPCPPCDDLCRFDAHCSNSGAPTLCALCLTFQRDTLARGDIPGSGGHSFFYRRVNQECPPSWEGVSSHCGIECPAPRFAGIIPIRGIPFETESLPRKSKKDTGRKRCAMRPANPPGTQGGARNGELGHGGGLAGGVAPGGGESHQAHQGKDGAVQREAVIGGARTIP